MRYEVVLREFDEGFSVSCLGLPGCWSQGRTEEEALEDISSAIREYLDALHKLAEGSNVRVVEVTV